MIKGVICDLDGFLVETWGEKPLDGVVEALEKIRRRGILLSVATNQAGPLWRTATGQAKYPSVQDVATRLLTCAKALDLETDLWCIALSDERAVQVYANGAQNLVSTGEMMPMPLPSPQELLWLLRREMQKALSPLRLAIVSDQEKDRKPNPGMLLAACNHWGIQMSEAVYGGDMDTDRKAAEAAGIRFVEKLSDVLALLEVSDDAS